MSPFRLLLSCAVMAGLLPAIADAQSRTPRVAIGAVVGLVNPSEPDAAPQLSIGPLFRFGENRAGWGPAIGLGWFSTVLEGSPGAANGEYAKVSIRPIMAGISHAWRAGRWSYEAALTAGYAFNSVELLDAGRRVFPGTEPVDVEISNSFAMRPRVRAFYEVNDRVDWMIGTGVTFTKPELTFRSGARSLTKELGRAAWEIEGGVAFRVF